MITLTFNDMDEEMAYCLRRAEYHTALMASLKPKHPLEDAARELGLDMDKLAAETAKLPEAQEEPKMAQEEPKDEKTEEPASAPEKPQKIDESLRVEVRKMLATLNKMQTGNPAKQLIAATGYKRLTDVPLELLPDLRKQAEEALNNA